MERYMLNGFYTKHFEEVYPIIEALAKRGFAQSYHTCKANNPNYWFTRVDSVCTEATCLQVYDMVKEAIKSCPNAIMEIY